MSLRGYMYTKVFRSDEAFSLHLALKRFRKKILIISKILVSTSHYFGEAEIQFMIK